MIKEFKDFINEGNLVEMAVAFVLGTAFAGLVSSFTDDILMQILAIFGGTPDFSALTVTINDAEIFYGSFLNAVVAFLIIGFAMFVVVKTYNRFKREQVEEEVDEQIQLLTEIRDALRNRS